MFIAVAESLQRSGTVAPEALLDDLARRYEPARGFGRGMKLALRAHASGTHWRDVARTAWPEGSRGNGGAVRAGAVALRHWITTSDLVAAVELATVVTHAHPEAMAAAVLQASLVAVLLEEPEIAATPETTLDRLEQELAPNVSVERTLATLRIATTTEADVAATFGTSPLASESVPAAIAVFLRNSHDFPGAVRAAAALGGDVDSICALVGCLAGAAHGYDKIPVPWIEAIARESPRPAELLRLADSVFDLPPSSFAAPNGSC